jgi:hypothetical protein
LPSKPIDFCIEGVPFVAAPGEVFSSVRVQRLGQSPGAEPREAVGFGKSRSGLAV